jgi:preprotein translocase subunit SecG
MTGRGQANALTRATAILAALFFLTSMALAIMASTNRAPRSILDGATPSAPAGQAPATPQGGNVLEQLQRMQGEQPAPAPGASAPAAPAAPQVPQSQ